jgi:hypothetical protein
MFLWLVLQIQSLCAMRTDKDIRNALANLPRDLSAIYSRILEQSRQGGQSYREEIFELLIAARRPLTVHEMQEALSVTPGDTNWDSSKLINDMYPVLATCGCLVVIDEDELTIRTVHPSVDRFFLDRYSARDETEIVASSSGRGHNLMASIIVTYFSYGIFGTELVRHLLVLDIGLAPSKVIDFTAGTAKGIQSMALKLLKSRKQPTFNASNVIADSFQQYRTIAVEKFHFYLYAKQYALSHLLEQPTLSKDVTSALSRLLQRCTIILDTHEQRLAMFQLEVVQPRETEPIALYDTHFHFPYHGGRIDRHAMSYIAIDNDHAQAIGCLLNLCLLENREVEKATGLEGDRPVNKQNSGIGSAALLYAIRKYRNEVVEMLIDSTLIDDFMLEEGDKAVQAAVSAQNHVALEIMLRKCQVPLNLQEKRRMLLEVRSIGTFPSRTIELFENYDVHELLGEDDAIALHDERPVLPTTPTGDAIIDLGSEREISESLRHEMIR